MKSDLFQHFIGSLRVFGSPRGRTSPVINLHTIPLKQTDYLCRALDFQGSSSRSI